MISFGCDHAGFALKKTILDYLDEKGYEYVDNGCYDENSVDYPLYGEQVALDVARGECDRGILICGTGIGISIAANKIPGIRAAHCSDPVSVKLSRLHNDSNILAFGARIVGPETAIEMVEAFLTTPFSEGPRHKERIAQIARLEEKYSVKPQ